MGRSRRRDWQRPHAFAGSVGQIRRQLTPPAHLTSLTANEQREVYHGWAKAMVGSMAAATDAIAAATAAHATVTDYLTLRAPMADSFGAAVARLQEQMTELARGIPEVRRYEAATFRPQVAQRAVVERYQHEAEEARRLAGLHAGVRDQLAGPEFADEPSDGSEIAAAQAWQRRHPGDPPAPPMAVALLRVQAHANCRCSLEPDKPPDLGG
jgi:hypothetical protein